MGKKKNIYIAGKYIYIYIYKAIYKIYKFKLTLRVNDIKLWTITIFQKRNQNISDSKWTWMNVYAFDPDCVNTGS